MSSAIVDTGFSMANSDRICSKWFCITSLSQNNARILTCGHTGRQSSKHVHRDNFCVVNYIAGTGLTRPVSQQLAKQLLLLHLFNGPLFQDNLGKPVPERYVQSWFKWGKTWWGFGMQWNQLDHMQTICTSLQTDNLTNTSSLNFYRPNAHPDAQTTVSKYRRP